jgi:hypothetical protein
MKAWLGALILLVAGFAAGFAAAPRGDPAALESLRQDRDAAKARADRAEADLAAAREAKPRRRETAEQPKGAVAADTREAFDDPKKAPAAKDAAPAPLTAEARAKRLNEIRAAIHTYFENHEGEKALAALKELAALGPEARDDAMKLAMDINADVQGAGELRLSMFTFYTGLGDSAVRDLMMWSLDNQASSPPGFRVMSAWSVPWVMKSDDAIARFDTALSHESDRGVQSAIVSNLGSMNNAKAESVLARVFGDPSRDAAMRADAAIALAGSKDPAIQHQVEEAAAGDPDPRVQAAAKISLIVRDPPATGCLVTQLAPDGNAEAAGIRPGDVIVAYNGRTVATNDDLVRERDAATAASADSVPVLVVRDGRQQTINVKTGRLGLTNMLPVKKK